MILKNNLQNSLDKCPNCGGYADNGHDRECPPNPYYCSKCTEEEFPERAEADFGTYRTPNASQGSAPTAMNGHGKPMDA